MTQPYHHGALRAALLEAAESILDREGIAGLTLRAAAREAGVSHAAPAHHFGDLAGLLTALAAAGFVRLRADLEAGIEAAPPDRAARLIALGRFYVGFARAHPGLFRLMFRSERLDWEAHGLAEAGAAAFALLTQDEHAAAPPGARPPFAQLSLAMARWSLVHGLATLLVDGRVEPLLEQYQDGDIETLIEAVLASLAPAP